MKIEEYEVEVLSKNHVKVGCQLVTRPEVERVLRAMDEWKPTPKFKVGDFVRVRKDAVLPVDYKHAPRGKSGKVVSTEVSGFKGDIGVEFPDRLEGDGWSLNDATKHGHGYCIPPECLELVD